MSGASDLLYLSPMLTAIFSPIFLKLLRAFTALYPKVWLRLAKLLVKPQRRMLYKMRSVTARSRSMA